MSASQNANRSVVTKQRHPPLNIKERGEILKLEWALSFSGKLFVLQVQRGE